tara:strand:+ start:11 stop:556 length:546 start_codon:yes stop_codon:yes gene_type:complete
MENEFKEAMSQRTDEELIKIVTIEWESYDLMAVEAAKSEIERRNIGTTVIKKYNNREKVIVKNYKGKQSDATSLFERDAIRMADKGYYPTSQSWAQGSYGCGSFIFALLLCILIIGLVIFIYMLVVKPDGILSVTYELKEENTDAKYSNIENLNEKECAQCAEKVKVKAKICRFCRYEFKN